MAFIALSGVRVQNKELMGVGLTLPGFVERSKVIASLPSLGLLTLAGMTPESYDVSYHECPDLESEKSLPVDVDLVIISSFTAKILHAYSLADGYRKKGIKVILGGLHVTACPQEAQLHADTIVLGEGETSWPLILKDLERDRLQPLYDGRNFNYDFSNAPLPRHDLLDVEAYNRLTIQTQRGCPYACSFCASSIRLNPKFKVKPIEKIEAELQSLLSIWKHPFLELADDNTFADREHGHRIAELFMGKGLRWFTETDISVAKDDDLLGKLRDSGCAQLLIGLESPDADGLSGLEKKADWKYRQVDNYLESISKIQSHGITVNGCFVLGLDGQDLSIFEKTKSFITESGLSDAQLTVQTPFPGTPLREQLKKEGRLLQENNWDHFTLFDVNYRPSHMSVQELEDNFKELMVSVYSEGSLPNRREIFRQRKRTP